MYKYFLLLLIALSTNTFAQHYPIEYEKLNEPETIYSNIIAKANNTNSFICDFRYNITNHDVSEISLGTIYFNSPYLLKWKYYSPALYEVIFTKKKVMIIEDNISNEYFIEADPGFIDINSIIKSVFNTTIFKSDYYIINYYQNDTKYLLQLIPLEEKKNIQDLRIDLIFNKIDYGLIAIKIITNSLEYVNLELSQRYINTKLPKETFKY